MTVEITVEPIVKRAEVDCSVEHAFRTFTERLDTWWPLHTHSVAAYMTDGARRAVSARLEPRVGGRLYETMDDGTEGFWAEGTAWEPPHRLANHRRVDVGLRRRGVVAADLFLGRVVAARLVMGCVDHAARDPRVDGPEPR